MGRHGTFGASLGFAIEGIIAVVLPATYANKECHHETPQVPSHRAVQISYIEGEMLGQLTSSLYKLPFRLICLGIVLFRWSISSRLGNQTENAVGEGRIIHDIDEEVLVAADMCKRRQRDFGPIPETRLESARVKSPMTS